MHKEVNNITNIIYKNISQRIRSRKLSLHKSRLDITNNSNVQLLSNIMHNRRLPKRNPYLLNPSITQDIVRNLKFSSVYELIWGSGDELDSLLSILFETGINILENENTDLIEHCLYDFLPYCRDAAEFDHACEPFKPEIEYVATEQDFAKSYLYFYLEDNWKNKHKKFFFNKGCKKIDILIDEFITTQLPILLNTYLNETNHSGLITYRLISEIIERNNASFSEDLANGPEYSFHQPVTNSDEPVATVRNEVVNAGEKYIDALVNEQIETDLFFADFF